MSATGTLDCFVIKGRQSFFKRNLSFGGYSTASIRRTLGSVVYLTNINLLSRVFELGKLPLYRKEKQRRKDNFRFRLKTPPGNIISVHCSAVMNRNEAFRLLNRQDSSFWGSNNTDLLAATVETGGPGGQWEIVAANLNAGTGREQGGQIKNGTSAITFKLTTLLLREPAGHDAGSQSHSFLNLVYAFYHNGTIVGAVSVKEAGRRFWISGKISPALQQVIAATAVVLTIRQNLYN